MIGKDLTREERQQCAKRYVQTLSKKTIIKTSINWVGNIVTLTCKDKSIVTVKFQKFGTTMYLEDGNYTNSTLIEIYAPKKK